VEERAHRLRAEHSLRTAVHEPASGPVRGGCGITVNTGSFLKHFPVSPASPWQIHKLRFMSPGTLDPEMTRLTLGQWGITGWIDYDAIELFRVK